MNQKRDTVARRYVRRYFPHLLAMENQEFVILVYEGDPESGSCTSHKTIGFTETVFECQEAHKEYLDSQIKVPQTPADVICLLLSVSDYYISAMTKEQWDAKHAEKGARELEASAARIASKYGVSVHSTAFLDACQTELDNQSSYREGLQEDGLCATAYPGSLAGYVQWQEMQDDSQSASTHASHILEWAEKYMPLMYAMWQDQQMAKNQ